MMRLFLLSLLPLVATASNLTLAVVVGESSFFWPVEAGWNKKCNELGVSCLYRVANSSDPDYDKEVHLDPCAWQMRLLMDMGVDGIAAKCGFNNDPRVFREAQEKGIPVVVFDTSPPEEEGDYVEPAAYIGTDNGFMGRTLARLLKQLKTTGGTYAIIAKENSKVQQERIDGFVSEIEKENDRDDRPNWFEVERNLVASGNSVGAMEKMEYFAAKKPTAMITMYQGPMREENWTQFVDANRNITFVGTDGSEFQLEYLSQRYVDGLVGQLPYEMGVESAQALYNILSPSAEAAVGDETESVPDAIPTNLVSYNLIPLELPDLDFEENLLDGIRWIGYTFFAIVAVLVFASVWWTSANRKMIVIRASQPFFLFMTSGGVILMAASLIPLSMDDMGDPIGEAKAVAMCMSIPWLAFSGFTVMFSALFSKTWRVNKIFHAKSMFSRVTVKEKDVLAPFFALMFCNIIVLICWTIIDPLTYVREFDRGTDFWNREIESRGSCQSEYAGAYLVPLGIINFTVLCIASWQAWQSRDIESEFSESTYIGLAVFSTLQAFMTGIPLVTIVRKIPQAFYIVVTLLVFLLCLSILLLIFLPKVIMQRRCAGMSDSEQRKMLAVRIRQPQRMVAEQPRSPPSGQASTATPGSQIGALKAKVSGGVARDPVSSTMANATDSNTVQEGSVPASVVRESTEPVISTLSSALEGDDDPAS